MGEVEVLVELGEEHRILTALPVRVIEEIAVLVVVDDTVIGILRRLADDKGIGAELAERQRVEDAVVEDNRIGRDREIGDRIEIVAAERSVEQELVVAAAAGK